MSRRLFFLAYIGLFFFSPLLCSIKGSESELSIEPFYTFSSSDSDNTMLGFGWFKNGFALEDATTSCTFSSVFPVSGEIFLNGGHLYLSEDLLLRNVATLRTSGRVSGNRHLVDLCSSIESLGGASYQQVFANTDIIIHKDLILSGSLVFQGDCFLNGNKKTISLGDDGYIIVDAHTTVTLKDVFIDKVEEGKIVCLGEDSRIVFDTSCLGLVGDYRFVQGGCFFQGKNKFFGQHVFSYESGQTSTIGSGSSLVFSKGVNFIIGKKDAKSTREPLYFVDQTSVLKLDNCSLYVTSSGMAITRGVLEIEKDVVLDIDSTTPENGFVLGDGTSENDMQILFYPGSAVHCVRGCLVNDVTNPGLLKLLQGNATLKRSANSTFYVYHDFVLANLIVDTDVSSQTIVKEGKVLTYDNCLIKTAYADFLLTGVRGSDYCNFLIGNDEIFMHKGTLPLYSYIWNSNNKIRGNGNISGLIVFQDEGTELRFDLNGLILTDVVMNGGTIFLDNDLHISQNNCLRGEGHVVLNNKSIYLGSQDMVWTSSICWEGCQGRVHMNSKIDLLGTWTFKGDVILNGHGQTLHLNSIGKIVIEEGSSLTFRDFFLQGITNDSVCCLSDNATIILDGVKWFQSGDYSFTTGCMSINRQVLFDGDYTFSYESAYSSTIEKDSSWQFDSGMTLWIGRNDSVDGAEPLYFRDDSSILILDDCSLHITSSGMRMTNGSLLIGGEVQIDCDGTSSTDSLILGNGKKENDFSVGFKSGSTARFKTGAIVYELAELDGFWVRYGFAKLIREPESLFYLNTPAVLANMKLEDRSPAKAVIVNEGGGLSYDNCTVKLSGGVSYDITAKRYNYYTNWLDGNKEIFISKGTLPSYLLVHGQGNLLRGNGDVTGAIFIQGVDSELLCNLQGKISNDIALDEGSLVCLGDLCLLHDSVIKGQGKVDLGANSFEMGVKDSVWTSTVYWEGDGGELKLNSDIYLSGVWTFSGNCVLSGGLHTLELDTDSEIIVEKGSSLLIKDIVITSLLQKKIRCLDNEAAISFQNVRLLLNGDYTFSLGSMQVYSDLHISGMYKFIYQSELTSIICANSRMMLDNGVTFSFDTLSKTPLSFCDKSSIIKLKNSALHATNSLELTRGTMVICGISCVSGESEEILFGNEKGEDDFTCCFLESSRLNFLQGSLCYKNMRVDSFNMDYESNVLRIGAKAFFEVYQDVYVNSGKIIFASGAQVLLGVGKNIHGSVSSEGLMMYGSL